jgi:hypothetical protein
MRTLDQILTKKDYSRKTPASLFYKDSPLWQRLLTIGSVVFLSCAGLGEWKVLNGMLGGLPKAISLGVIGLAVLYALFFPDEKRFREIWKPALLYMSLMVALFFWSLVIWIESFAAVSSMTRSCSKLLFQSIAILTAVALVYLFREKAIELFTISICITNGAIMLLCIPEYGIGASIQSLVTCLVTFGDAVGYARQLEIHDLTFVFGQMILYYAVFAPRTTRQEKRKRWLYLLACIWFFLVGMKRSAIPTVLLFILIALLLRKRKVPSWLYPTVGVCCILFFLVFLYGVRNGIVSRLLNSVGVDMMGRDYLWSMANPYYEFSVTYLGHGFEYVDTIIGQWYSAGLINHPYPFHNDILKVFVELGFPGFLLWSGIQYVLTPLFWQHYADQQTTLLYLCELGYMTVTYLTDNTAFYFWSTMALRLVAFSYAMERKKPPKPKVWVPDSRQEMRDRIRILMQEG